MARILQIRRGSAAQNDNFTGMPGELSMDTDTKTLRIHDGETLGGFTLARADQLPSSYDAPAFDIATVPDDFWTALFERFGHFNDGAMYTVLTGRDVPLFKTTYMDYTFNTDKTPFLATCTLVCQTASCGYSAGEEVSAFGFGDMPVPAPNVFRDNTGVHVRMMMGTQDCWVCARNTGVRTVVNMDAWNLRIRLYC